jgi:molybdopterin converting factor small subunit
MRDLTGGKDRVSIQGGTIGEVLANLEEICPGVRARLCRGEELSPHIAVVVDGQVSTMGAAQPLNDRSEVYFAPVVAGG